MKPHFAIQHHGNLDSTERVEFTFDVNSVAHLMSVLTDTYSDRELAAIREPATNALDSHIAAGNPDPIHITLPTALDPTYKVQDYGLGMSRDDLTNHFSKYGWSSKRDNDDEVGSLGIGCKAPLTYTPQFTVTAVKDGVRTLVLVTRLESGAGALQVMDETETDEPNGVLVAIPVKDVDSFNDKCINKLFKFWPKGSVLIDGEEPEHYTDDPNVIEVDPDIHLMPYGMAGNRDWVVMGGVAYEVPPSEGRLYTDNYRVVAQVPIGSIDFAPSREQLTTSKRTRECLVTIKEFVRDHMMKVAQAEIDECQTYGEALKTITKWSTVFDYGRQQDKFTWNGERLPWHHNLNDGLDRREMVVCSPHSSAKAKRSIAKVYAPEVIDCVFVTGFTGRYLTQEQKDAVAEYCMATWSYRGRCYFVPAQKLDRWLQDCKHVEWKTVKPKAVSGPRGPRVETTYYCASDGKYYTAKTMPTDKPVCWTPISDKDPDYVRTTSFMSERCYMFRLARNQVAKFERAFPQTETYTTLVEHFVAEWVEALSDDQKVLLTASIPYEHDQWIRDLRPRELDDPWLRDTLKRLQACRDGSPIKKEWSDLQVVCAQARVTCPSITAKATVTADIKAVVNKYPLVEYAGRMYNDGRAKINQYLNETYLIRDGLHLARAC